MNKKGKKTKWSVIMSNLAAAKASLLFVLIFLVLYFGLKYSISPNASLKEQAELVLESILLTAIGVSTIAIVWETTVRRQFLTEVRETLKVSENLHRSGIVRVRSDFGDVSWETFYEEADRIDLAVFHARDTISHNRDYIIKAAKRGIPIRVKFPDPANNSLISILNGDDDSYEKEGLINSIIESINYFIGLAEEIDNSDIIVKIVSMPFPFSIYKSTDKMSVLILSKQMKYNYSNLVIFECDGQGQMAGFSEKNIEDICQSVGVAVVEKKLTRQIDTDA